MRCAPTLPPSPTLLVAAVLQVGAFAGLKMTNEEIEKLMNAMHRIKVEHVVKKKDSPP